MSDELVTVAEFDMVFDAEMAKDYLEDNDIKASVVGDDLIAISPAVGKTMVEVKVFEKDAERAKVVLEEHKKQCRQAADEQAKGECDCDTDNDCDCQGDA
jgi:hypothetical protein